MTIESTDGLRGTPSPASPEGSRRPWLVMQASATAALLPGGSPRGDGVGDPAAFLRRLRDELPRLAVLATPPAAPSDVLAALAERRRRPDLCLILVNPDDDVGGRLDALALGFDEAFPASMDAREVLGRVRRLLDVQSLADRARRASSFVIGPGLELDRLAKRVRLDGRDVHLRPREFALLDALAASPGRVIPRAELIDRVWGSGYRGNARTVDVHIRWLRAKLEAVPAKPVHVITVRGTGYRLDCDGT